MSLCSVYNKNAKVIKNIHVPSVIRYSPIRPDVVNFVHTNITKNSRQPYGRYNKAGHQHSAESWGTGRAVSRVPRISGSGTSRNGQGAFANMTRGGRMFSPLKIWRRWHRMVNVTQKRYAMCSAIAASAVPSLVMAHGHRIEKVPEIPLVVSNDIERIKKTKEALRILSMLHATNDIKRSADSRKIRAGQGKMRNRRYVQRKGVLIVHAGKQGLSRACRNISGVNCINVCRLNLKEMAPGGHVGRFVIWTEAAFRKLDKLYGTRRRDAMMKRGYRHPTSHMVLTDLDRIIHSGSVQRYVQPKKHPHPRIPRKRGELLLLPAKKVKGPVTKRTNLVDPWGVPLRRKERRVVLRKLKAEKKAKKEAAKKARLDRIQKAIARAKAKREANKKKMAEAKKQMKDKKVKPVSKAEKRKAKQEEKKKKIAELAKAKALKKAATTSQKSKKAKSAKKAKAASKAKDAKKDVKKVEKKPKTTTKKDVKKTEKKDVKKDAKKDTKKPVNKDAKKDVKKVEKKEAPKAKATQKK
eukprot:MONOS_5711.1-p1 / transcript=MONOS_5711.1 / gene=MONOS_5711 / organism=Monocercomonoides_exilis_PA203 / gene_product=Large subunit ribosomal protein L4e / transcript_product=Large subunit ribosomal protein L4e / location=Mono_scaffold00169:101267-103181(-) / protein_length=524 / sequence_SO=supercontig / SO=protein_coding / is_pseudo=false